MPRSTPALPTPYAYLDYRAYLSDWFTAKKKANPKFSHRMFARLAGQKSPSLLHHVIHGARNLTPATTTAFSGAMKLPTAEAEFFALLVRLGQATTDDERNEAWERIAATRRFREARKVDGAGVEYLSHWFYPAIRELAYRPDFRDEPDWIAQTLRPKVPRSRVARALEVLRELKLLVEDDHGTLRPADATVVTPHEVAGLAVHNYHQGMLSRAAEAIDAFAPEERQFGGLTVAVPEELVPVLKQELAAFQERFLHLCDTAEAPAERVYQLNIQLFPLSEPRES